MIDASQTIVLIFSTVKPHQAVDPWTGQSEDHQRPMSRVAQHRSKFPPRLIRPLFLKWLTNLRLWENNFIRVKSEPATLILTNKTNTSNVGIGR